MSATVQPGGAVKFAILTGDETPADLQELIANLRERQRRTPIRSIRDEINADVNEALDAMALLDGQPQVRQR